MEGLCRPGEIVGERYRIDRLLGSGTFAEVYLAVDMVLERQVAVKVLNTSKITPPAKVDRRVSLNDTVTRFYKEAKLVAKLKDQHTVKIYDFGSTADGKLYMAQEFIDGQPLKALLEKERALDAERVARILVQTLRSLREAHTYGLLHRDIKPENIMVFDYLGERDNVRLVDFGIAKTLGEESSELTAAGVLVGTPRYVAPERVSQKELLPASDIYSLGVVAYEMATGQELFPGKGMMEVIRAHIDPSPIVLPAQPPIPKELRRIIEKMLAKDLNQRYGAAQQAIADLDQFLAALTIARATDKDLEQSLETARTVRMDAVPVLMQRDHGAQAPQVQRTERPGHMQTIQPGQDLSAPKQAPNQSTAPPPNNQKTLILAAAIVAFGILIAAGVVIAALLGR